MRRSWTYNPLEDDNFDPTQEKKQKLDGNGSATNSVNLKVYKLL